MDGFIDIHCHILHSVDDGPQKETEMKKMLKMAWDDGIRKIIATPHYHPYVGRTDIEIIHKNFSIMKDAAHEIDENFEVYLGAEIFFKHDISELLEKRKVATINNSRYILIEFKPTESFRYMLQNLQMLQMLGYEVVLAHVERYKCLRENIEFAEDLERAGVHIQVNAGSIIGKEGRVSQKYVKTLMRRDLVFAVGTDAHGIVKRVPQMKKAANYVRKRFGEEYERRIFFDNALVLLENTEKDEF